MARTGGYKLRLRGCSGYLSLTKETELATVAVWIFCGRRKRALRAFMLPRTRFTWERVQAGQRARERVQQCVRERVHE